MSEHCDVRIRTRREIWTGQPNCSVKDNLEGKSLQSKWATFVFNSYKSISPNAPDNQ